MDDDPRERGDETPRWDAYEAAVTEIRIDREFQRQQNQFNQECWDFDERVAEWLQGKRK